VRALKKIKLRRSLELPCMQIDNEVHGDGGSGLELDVSDFGGDALLGGVGG
jgi:hypothetical protein